MKLDVGMLTHDLATIPDYARKVEALGYDCLWSAETQHDPFLPLAVAATVTARIKLGTSIAVAFPRSPMVLAQTSWDLAKASRVSALLILEAEVDVRGYVKAVKVLRGHPLFDDAAQEALKQWRYQPLLLNGEPTGFILTVTMNFNLQQR